MDAGRLCPIVVDPVYPGDTIQLSTHMLCRLSTPIKPLMANQWVDVHWFFAPNRILFDDWEKLQGAQDNPGDSINFILPTIEIEGGGMVNNYQTVADYMGIPPEAVDKVVQSLPFRMYNMTWNQHYRDQNINDSIFSDTGTGPDFESNFPLQYRAKQPDMFTKALGSPQKGPDVTFPLAGIVPIIPAGDATPTFRDGPGAATDNVMYNESSGNNTWDVATASTQIMEWDDPKLEGELDTGTNVKLSVMREAFTLQHILELDQRVGTRYTEQLLGRWGIVSSDQSLQRVQYIGGGSTPMNIIPVQNTSNASSGNVGELSSYALAEGSNASLTFSAEEHGILMAICSIRTEQVYQHGIDRFWSYSSRYDFMMPELTGLGEQAILNEELYCDGSAADKLTFGFTARYDELRYNHSKVMGVMRSSHPLTLDVYHLAQYMLSLPTLSPDFIREDPPVGRITEVASQPHYQCDMWINWRQTRVLPSHGVPGIGRL